MTQIIAITQARMGSTRLPGKILKKIKGKSLLEIHIDRILKSKKINKLIVATTIDKADSEIVDIAKNCNVDSYRGSVDDVLDRYYQTAKRENPKWVIRLTSDCPLIDGDLIDMVISKAINEDLDYCSNTLIEAFPDGQDIEVFKFAALEKAWNDAVLKSDREHVTPFIKNNSSFYNKNLFVSGNFACDSNFNNVRLTVDEAIDFEVIKSLVLQLGFDATWMEYTKEYLDTDISKLNSNIIRNEGYKKSLKND